jgi:alpha-D-xyloside xylohydrolase
MVVRVAPGDLPEEKLPQAMPLDALNLQLREQYFGGGGGGMLRTTTHCW